MQVIGRLQGKGFLVLDGGEPTGPVAYEMEIQEEDSSGRGGFGRIEAPAKLCFGAFMAIDVRLRLATGNDVDIIVPEFTPGGSFKFLIMV